MSRHIDEARLNDYVDGLLDVDDAAAIETHLQDCVSCRAATGALRSLVGDVRALPREIPPPAHLRATVLSAATQAPTEPAPVLPLRKRREALRSLRYPLAAAAVVLIALTAVVTRWAVRRDSAPPAVAAAPEAPPAPAPTTSPVATPTVPGKPAEPESSAAPAAAPEASLALFRREVRRYDAEIERLQKEVEARQEQLSPETRRILERNLAIIDRALAESRAAVEKDPRNRTLAPLILSVYEQKLQLLRRAREYAS